jgi:hypothetical protein
MCDKPAKQLDWGKPLQTADGRDAVLLTKEFESGFGIRYVVMVASEDSSKLYLYFPDGRPANQWFPPLRNKTRKVTKWYNVYTSGPGGLFYTTREAATQRSNHALDLLEVRSIEIEEPL